MDIHALSTGTVRIKTAMQRGQGQGRTARLINTLRTLGWTEPLPIHVWVIDHPEGLILVDTGERASAHDLPFGRFSIAPEQELDRQLLRLGITPGDVRTVILTHLHGDHTNGLLHFPKSEILVSARELHHAQRLPFRIGRRLTAQRWPQWFAPRLVTHQPVPLGPFGHSYPVTRDGTVLLVPTPGHTAGHQSVIVQRAGISYFLAGDAAYSQELLLAQQPDGVGFDALQAAATMGTILRYAAQQPTVILPSHDPDAARRLRERTALAITPAALA
jgi:glyoxylase-like metal-dependent hydrolase (beta-lactamase superfamily II)